LADPIVDYWRPAVGLLWEMVDRRMHFLGHLVFLPG